jgi:hypothetical protein
VTIRGPHEQVFVRGVGASGSGDPAQNRTGYSYSGSALKSRSANFTLVWYSPASVADRARMPPENMVFRIVILPHRDGTPGPRSQRRVGAVWK